MEDTDSMAIVATKHGGRGELSGRTGQQRVMNCDKAVKGRLLETG